jgi:hypothetical protein
MKQKLLTFAILLLAIQLYAQNTERQGFEETSKYPLIGDWKGQWINPKRGHEVAHSNIAAQINIIDGNRYMVHILPELYNRATLYLDVEMNEENQQLIYDKDGWSFNFSGDSCTGYGNLNGDKIWFKMSKSYLVSPTLGMTAPSNAIELLSDSGLNHWKQDHGKEKVAWKMNDGVLETVSVSWNNGENRKNGIGGSIRTKQEFGDMQFHMEFRYPVEPGRTGQNRGNSGLIFHGLGIGEIQILNSYALQGYWDDAGSIYKVHPARVNAAGPPLYWQTYDVDLTLPRFNADGIKLSEANMTVRLNGIIIHNQQEIKTNARKVIIGLQDHINCLQYRNIWVLEK